MQNLDSGSAIAKNSTDNAGNMLAAGPGPSTRLGHFEDILPHWKGAAPFLCQIPTIGGLIRPCTSKNRL